ncbi:MAG: sigma-70 family RNA polymerase sigma factor [Candidatus Buchananbacteria bacterium]|nr:sigma-70 family RNA polymerase sigma factor [Candidatus Buchananbacteria bacterium]
MAELPDFANKTDQELVNLTLENQDHFLHIVNRYQQKLLSFILRISNVAPDEAHDLLQEVFIKVYKNLNGYDPSLKFSSWIYRITRNHVISNYRKIKNKPQVLSWEVDEESLSSLTAEINIEKSTDQALLREQLAESLEKLKPKYREVLILRYFEEKSYDEISDIIKKPRGTVGTLINRAKTQLQAIYQPKI